VSEGRLRLPAMTVALLKAKGFTPDRKAGMGSAAVVTITF